MQIFGKMAKKLARGAISKFCFSGFLDIVDPYKPAKFGKDRFRNGGATTFFSILHGPLWRQHRRSVYIMIGRKSRWAESIWLTPPH